MNRRMSRHITKTRGVGRGLVLLTGATLLLAGCASASTSIPAVGQPSISINAPLTAVSCTTSGACVSVGASGRVNAPTAVAQVRNLKGVWSALQVPSAPVAVFNAGSCGVTRCLFGGAQGSRELLWSIDANTGSVQVLTGPAGGLVIDDLSCVNDHDCAVVDEATSRIPRLSFTTNAGVTWSAPRTLTWTAGKVTTLACALGRECYLAATSSRHHVILRQTLNAGVTWRGVTTPASWTSLRALSCTTACVALITTPKGSAVAAPSTAPKAQGWSETTIPFVAAGLACSSTTTCVAVGEDAAHAPAIARWQVHAVQQVVLTYVPTPLTAVACQKVVCVAIGVSTVVALQP